MRFERNRRVVIQRWVRLRPVQDCVNEHILNENTYCPLRAMLPSRSSAPRWVCCSANGVTVMALPRRRTSKSASGSSGSGQANHRNGTFGRPTGYADTHQLTRTQVLNTNLRLGR